MLARALFSSSNKPTSVLKIDTNWTLPTKYCIAFSQMMKGSSSSLPSKCLFDLFPALSLRKIIKKPYNIRTTKTEQDPTWFTCTLQFERYWSRQRFPAVFNHLVLPCTRIKNINESTYLSFHKGNENSSRSLYIRKEQHNVLSHSGPIVHCFYVAGTLIKRLGKPLTLTPKAATL